MQYPGVQCAPGQISVPTVMPAVFWRCPANSLAGPTSIAPNSGVVVDGAEAGGATLYGGNATQATRTVVGTTTYASATPHYGLNAGDDAINGYASMYGNVICPDTVAHARDRFGVYLGTNMTQGTRSANLAAGEKGMFQWDGLASCLVSITTALQQELTLEESVANSRAGTLRAAVAGERVHAIARQVVVGTATAPVVCIVEIMASPYNKNA